MPDGHWIYYYESGNKENEGDYSAGFECGPWTFYYDSQSACPGQACQVKRQGSLDGGYECGPAVLLGE